MDVANAIAPKLSGPITRARYGNVINGNMNEIPFRRDKYMKFAANVLASLLRFIF